MLGTILNRTPKFLIVALEAALSHKTGDTVIPVCRISTTFHLPFLTGASIVGRKIPDRDDLFQTTAGQATNKGEKENNNFS
jgi:hypothetical protein